MPSDGAPNGHLALPLPDASGRVYLSFLGDGRAERVRLAYRTRQYERPAELKRTYDPTNFFRLNQNIEP